jgi:hypothetical protein
VSSRTSSPEDGVLAKWGGVHIRSLPDDIPHAIQRLRQALQAYAAPLLGVLERVAVANVPLMWEVASLVEVDR